MGGSPPGCPVHGISTGRNTGVSCHFLLQGIFPTQGSDWCLLRVLFIGRQILYQFATWTILKTMGIVVVLVTQLYLTLSNPMDWCPRDSSVHGISQARILAWVAMPYSRVSSQPKDWTVVSCIADRVSMVWVTREVPQTVGYGPNSGKCFPLLPDTWGNDHIHSSRNSHFSYSV